MPETIIKNIRAKQFSPIYFLYGDEPYFIDHISDTIEHTVLQEAEKSFNQAVLYGRDVNAQQIVDQCVQYPLMAPYRVVIVKEAQNIKDFKNLESYFENPVSTSILVIAYKKDRITKTSKWYKAVKKTATIFESKKLYDNQVAPYIANSIRSYKRTISSKAAALLSEYLGNDLSKVHNEIEKLCLIVGEGQQIELLDIQEQVGISKEYNVFELQSAIGTKDFEKTFQIVNYFQDNPNAHPMVMVLSSLYRYFTKIWIANQNKGAHDTQLSKMMGLYNSYFLKEYKIARTKYSETQLLNAFSILKEYDLKTKGVDNRTARYNDLLGEMVAKIMV